MTANNLFSGRMAATSMVFKKGNRCMSLFCVVWCLEIRLMNSQEMLAVVSHCIDGDTAVG